MLGAPKITISPRVSWGLIALAIGFGVGLPMFGASLLAVLMLERWALSRVPKIRIWLGLHPPASSKS